MVEQESKQSFRFLLLQADNAASDFKSSCQLSVSSGRGAGKLTALVDEKRLFTSSWVGSNDRVLILDRLSSHNTIPVAAELSLLKTRMNRLKSMQSLLQWLRQTIIRLDLVGKKGVSSDFRLVKDV